MTLATYAACRPLQFSNRKTSTMSQIKYTALVGLGWLALSCAGAPPANLVDARAAYQRAADGPAERLAPAQLHAARTYLSLAEKTYEDEGDSANARDRAYVAMRKAELAEVQARIARSSAQAAEAKQQGELREQQQHAATSAQLARAQTELSSERGVIAQQGAQLQAETERRQKAEDAQSQALAALGKKEARGTVITLSGSVVFTSGGSELLPAARNKVVEVATALTQGDTQSRIRVEGHTDSTGSAAKNEELSIERANAVRDTLVSRGVKADRITTAGYGSQRPIADNATPAGRANNRRVEIVVEPKEANEPQGNQSTGIEK
jgi:outer membrane protein OmpA-like peptidoglycan-associated protein